MISGELGRLTDFQYSALEFKEEIKAAQDIQAKQAMNGTLGWETMAYDFNLFQGGSENPDFWDSYHSLRQYQCPDEGFDRPLDL